MNVPMNPGPGFNQLLDVLRNDIATYVTTGRGRFTEEAAGGEWKKRATDLHREASALVAPNQLRSGPDDNRAEGPGSTTEVESTDKNGSPSTRRSRS